MKIEKLNSENELFWRKFIEKNSNSRFQHLLEFKKIVENTYQNCESRYYMIKNKAIFPFFMVKSKLLGNRLISLPFLDNGGFLGSYNKENIKELIRELKKDEKIKHIEVRMNASSENFKKVEKILKDIGFEKEASRQQFIVRLTSEKDLWKRFHKHTRNDIRKAEKSNLKIKEIEDDSELKKFYKLYLKNMKFFGTPQHSYNFFKNLLEIAKRNMIGFNCYFKNKLIGSIILFYQGKHGYISYNVSDINYREHRPNDLLYWKTIKWAMKKGIKDIDLGQIDKNSEDERAIGLYKFKRKWLGETYDRTYFYYSFGRRKENIEKKDKLKKFRTVWKKLPLPIIKIFGPKVASEVAL